MNDYREKIVQDLQSTEFLEVLRSFLDVLKSCLGPKAGIKIFESSGGISVVTSSSSRVLNSYNFSHPICLLISQVIKSQNTVFGDYGLSTGILAMKFLEITLKETIIKQSQTGNFLQSFLPKIHTIFDNRSVKLNIDFSSVKQLIPITRTILSSKSGSGLRGREIDYLTIQIIKIFLHTLCDKFGDVIIVNGEEGDQTYYVNGILYQIDSEDKFVDEFISNMTENHSKISLLLFDIMLTNTSTVRKKSGEIEIEGSCDILRDATCILEFALKIGINIVGCQKVVHDSLRLLLQRNGILLIDRLGSELCTAIQKLSGAKPISSLKNISLENIKSSLGTVDSVKYINRGVQSFVVLERTNTNTVTLLLKTPSEEAFTELKTVVQQALQALRQVTCLPYVVPGAGCLEMWLACQLQVQDLCTSGAKLIPNAVVGWLQKSLISINQILQTSKLCIVADTVYCHSWNPDELNSCSCGLVCASDVKTAGGNWVQPNLFSVNNLVFPYTSQFPVQPLTPKQLLETAVVDVHISKCNAIKLALETCINALSIGIMIYKPPV